MSSNILTRRRIAFQQLISKASLNVDPADVYETLAADTGRDLDRFVAVQQHWEGDHTFAFAGSVDQALTTFGTDTEAWTPQMIVDLDTGEAHRITFVPQVNGLIATYDLTV